MGTDNIPSLNQIIAENTVYSGLSLEMILGTIFSPVMWLIGIAKEDVMLMGQLLGIKLASSEFVAYTQLSILKDIASAPHLMYNKSVIIATYMLCGFANFASIGIQLGGIGSFFISLFIIYSAAGASAAACCSVAAFFLPRRVVRFLATFAAL